MSQLAAVIVGLTLCSSCASLDTARPESSAKSKPTGRLTELQVQAMVMQMADEYISALGEATYLMAADAKHEPRARWLIQSFLRNGVGATIDIATGPNPNVALLDLLVVCTLQTWSFEKHWIPAGIDEEVGRNTVVRLKQAEANLWKMSEQMLDADDRRTLRELIDAWILANADRTVVAFVRFDEFTDARRTASADHRQRAAGLLRELADASATVDQARLLGERLIWFAGRYPFVMGEQAELTTYRIADQPEVQQLIATAEELRQLSDALTRRSNELPNDVAKAITQAEASLDRLSEASIDQTFDRFAAERTALLDDLQAREGDLRNVLSELQETIETSAGLAHELTGTVEAIDRVVARFDRGEDPDHEPIDMKDVRDAAIETGKAAEKLTTLLEETNRTLDSTALASHIDELETMTAGLVDRAFYRGLILIGMLIVGLAAIRLIPQRTKANRVTVVPPTEP